MSVRRPAWGWAVVTAATGTVLIGIGAFWLSFMALADLAARSGIAPGQAWIWPLLVDGLIVVSTIAVVALDGRRGVWYPWALLICGALVSVAANALHAVVAADASVPAMLAATVAAVPPLVLLASTHLTVVLTRSTTAPPSTTQAPPELLAATELRGRLDSREIEEIDSSALSAAEAKAISSGNPLLLEHSTVHTEVSRLRRLERAYHRNESMLAHARDRASDHARSAAADIETLEAVLPRITDTSGDKFRIELRGSTYTSRAEAAHALRAWAHDSDLKWAPRYAARDYGVIGQISGFDVIVSTSPALGADPVVNIRLDGVPRSGFTMTRQAFLEGGVGLIQRIENRTSGIPSLLEQARSDLDSAETERDDAEQRIGQPFRHAQALADAEKDLARIETQLAAMQEDIDQTEPDAPRPAEQRPDTVLTVETIRAHRPALGVRADPTRTPSSTGAFVTAGEDSRDLPPRGL